MPDADHRRPLAAFAPLRLVAWREIRLGSRGALFVLGSATMLAVLLGTLLVTATVVQRASVSRIGLSGQAIGLAGALRDEVDQLGVTATIAVVPDRADGVGAVVSGDLDVLVSGAPDALRATVEDRLDPRLRTALNDLVARQAVDSRLAEIGIRPADVHASGAAAGIDLVALRPDRALDDQRQAAGLVITVLLAGAVAMAGTMTARSVLTDKVHGMIDVLFATVGPRRLLLGKLLGPGLLGLVALLATEAAGLALAAGLGLPHTPDEAGTALAVGLLWYPAGLALYAAAFAASGALVSRRDDLPATVTPLVLTLVVTAVAGAGVALWNATGPVATVLSVLPPFAPMTMPTRMMTGAASGWQVGLSVGLTLGAAIGVGRLASRIYRTSALDKRAEWRSFSVRRST